MTQSWRTCRRINSSFERKNSTEFRNFLRKYAQPHADAIKNLSMAIVVDQRRLGGNSHSTLGTITDISPVLRLLFSRIGKPYIGNSNAFSFNDHIVDVGPHAGSNGGNIVFEGTYAELVKADTLTGRQIRQSLALKEKSRKASGKFSADWIIDMGPDGGTKGGNVVFKGTPVEL